MRRQSSLLERHSQLAPLAERNRKQAALVPVPTRRDGKSDGTAPTAYVTAYATATQIDPIVTGAVADAVQTGESIADRADRTFVAINKRLRELEHDQVQQIVSLTDELLGKASAIKTAAADAGIGLKITGETGTGGPYIPAKAGGAALDAGEFDARLEALDSAYETVDQVTEAVNAYPLASPAPGSPTSSTFGLRKDPFLGTSAMHSGIDFRAATGTPIRATGSGVVTSAGRNGGYGLMVEIDHGNGYSTRYAHMSAIKVREGQKVTVSDVVGLVGSTGRSTGPHLHYEVRMNGEARNPKRYLSAGANIRKFL
jgi:murein DD-endopeptidase MepM/ murein hydrolase activator NlpD